MSLAILHSRALSGIHAPPVEVEVHLANGLPQFCILCTIFLTSIQLH
jgi:magnesium chelatase family protein